jgi:hypothetical protein
MEWAQRLLFLFQCSIISIFYLHNKLDRRPKEKLNFSCLKIEFSRKPVAVGESAEIRLILESKKVDIGVFRRIVQIRSNSVGGTEILTIKGVAKD